MFLIKRKEDKTHNRFFKKIAGCQDIHTLQAY